jgi:hypothetical protein
MREAKRRCTPGFRAYQRLMEASRRDRLVNQERLRQLSVERRGEIQFICAHDVVELEAAQAGHPL